MQRGREKDSLIYQAKSTPDKEFLPFKKGQMDTEVLRHAVPIGVLILGVLVPVVLYAGGWFRLAVSGGTDWVKAAGAFIFFLAFLYMGLGNCGRKRRLLLLGMRRICYRSV